MFQPTTAFSGFSVTDLAKAKEFYTGTLSLKIVDEKMGLQLQLPNGGTIFIYEKPDHVPAVFTILSFVVTDIDAAVTELSSKGVSFEHYDNLPATQDEKGILRGITIGMGPNIAWFKDPSGNIIAVLQDS
jgi:catechol 2,3-dioxygenase-like lactoylglutathione lyase family enzyme